MPNKETDTFCPTSQRDWRRWLTKNHNSKQSVWLILYKKESSKPSINWGEAVDQALCFGWVDSKRKPFNEEKFLQFFSKRKPKGTWSKINKEKVRQLTGKGLMTQAGLDSIETAKQNGAWVILDDVEQLKIPNDLAKEFRAQPGSKAFFLSLSKSVRKAILQWFVLAKRSETRRKRIAEVAALAALGRKPKQF